MTRLRPSKRWTAALLVACVPALLVLCARAADTPGTLPSVDQPPLPPMGWAWPRVCDELTKALVDGNTASARALIDDHAIIHLFNRNQPVEIEPLVESLRGQKVIGVHARPAPPTALAADLAADFKAAANIPTALRDEMVPRDDQAMHRANTTAQQWVQTTLDTATGDPIGVIVLLPPPPTTQPGAAPTTQDPRLPIFLLIKGKEIAPGHFKVIQIVFGVVAEAKPQK